MATSTQEVEKQVTRKGSSRPPSPERPPEYPSHRKVVVIGLLIVVVLIAGFFAGWLPRTRTTMEVNAESKQETARLPIVTVIRRSEPLPKVRSYSLPIFRPSPMHRFWRARMATSQSVSWTLEIG